MMPTVTLLTSERWSKPKWFTRITSRPYYQSPIAQLDKSSCLVLSIKLYAYSPSIRDTHEKCTTPLGCHKSTQWHFHPTLRPSSVAQMIWMFVFGRLNHLSSWEWWIKERRMQCNTGRVIVMYIDRDALQSKYKYNKEIKKISKHRHIPKYILNAK